MYSADSLVPLCFSSTRFPGMTGRQTAIYTPTQPPSRVLDPQFYSEGIQLLPAPGNTGRTTKKIEGRLRRKREQNQWQSNWGGTKLDNAASFSSSQSFLFFFFAWSAKKCMTVYFVWTHHISFSHTQGFLLFLYSFFLFYPSCSTSVLCSMLSLFPLVLLSSLPLVQCQCCLPLI